MTADLLASAPERIATPHVFIVLWQSPSDRVYRRVGTLTRDSDGYRFRYTPAAASIEGFHGFASFPDFAVEYRSDELFATFANRVMTPRRDSYDAYVQALGLHDARPEPFEVLARTLGTRATDLVQLLPAPTIDKHGLFSIYFLVHGSRHVDPAATQLGRVHNGDQLFLAPEEGNPVSPVAVLVGSELDPTPARALGCVPDVLGELVRALLASGAPVRATAEQVNNASQGQIPDHMRLLVRLDAVPSEGFDLDATLPA